MATLSRDSLTRRTLTAAVIGVVLIGSVLVPSVWGLALVVAGISGLSAAEFYAITRREHRLPNEIFGVLAAITMPLAAAEWGLSGLTVVMSALIVLALAWYVAFRQVTLADSAITVFGAVYIGFTLAHLVLIRDLTDGVGLALLVLFSVWANDVFAYLAGSAFGRHKLAPHISPNKSWEGFIAGAVLTVAVWVGGYFILGGMPLWGYAAAGAAVTIAAVVGDLGESRLKREAAVKDSGTSLPGHGGFLDRFDSLTLVSVVAFYLLLFVSGGSA